MKKSLISLSLASSLLLAQNNEELFSMSLEDLLNVEVSTTSKYSEKLIDSPANIYLFTKETIRERAYFSVTDILESLPSVDVNKFSRVVARDDISIRGIAGNNKFLILLNGVRISAPAGGVMHIGYNFPVAYAKQVEVILGPTGVIYGADAYAGVVNILTETDKDLIELYASAGQDNYFNSFANISHNFNSFHLNAFISGYQSQEYKLKNNYPDLYPSPAPSNVQNGYSFAPTKDIVFFTNVATENFEVGINHFENEASLNFSVKAEKSSFDENSKNIHRVTNLYAKAKFDIIKELYSTTTLSFAREERDKKTYFSNSFSSFKPAYKYSKVDKYSLNQDFLLQVESHQISLGISLDHINVIPRGADLSSPYDTSKSSTKQNINYIDTNTSVNFNEYTYQNYGIYIQDNYELNHELRLVVAARYDTNTLYNDTFNPRAALIYKATYRDVFKFLYSNAFLAPASDQIYNEYGDITQKDTGFSFRHVSNSSLKPEELQTLELNYEHSTIHR
ncbi:TonB-dependent receptor; Outer membrane receptor for ferrienterochelin and colicins [hydrothermal vent metagenome]|uniref:TonB-dependent receptor Outer membrane receptor for ferrienterochelin and colicins n=1 Tax=hydrothermal vent metagenome TaxID=652676 RepID=A0A1W1CKY1_9ZZZZ